MNLFSFFIFSAFKGKDLWPYHQQFCDGSGVSGLFGVCYQGTMARAQRHLLRYMQGILD